MTLTAQNQRRTGSGSGICTAPDAGPARSLYPLKKLETCLLLALALSPSPRGAGQLAVDTGWSKNRVTAGLQHLAAQGLVVRGKRYNDWSLTPRGRELLQAAGIPGAAGSEPAARDTSTSRPESAGCGADSSVFHGTLAHPGPDFPSTLAGSGVPFSFDPPQTGVPFSLADIDAGVPFLNADPDPGVPFSSDACDAGVPFLQVHSDPGVPFLRVSSLSQEEVKDSLFKEEVKDSLFKEESSDLTSSDSSLGPPESKEEREEDFSLFSDPESQDSPESLPEPENGAPPEAQSAGLTAPPADPVPEPPVETADAGTSALAASAEQQARGSPAQISPDDPPGSTAPDPEASPGEQPASAALPDPSLPGLDDSPAAVERILQAAGELFGESIFGPAERYRDVHRLLGCLAEAYRNRRSLHHPARVIYTNWVRGYLPREPYASAPWKYLPRDFLLRAGLGALLEDGGGEEPPAVDEPGEPPEDPLPEPPRDPSLDLPVRPGAQQTAAQAWDELRAELMSELCSRRPREWLGCLELRRFDPGACTFTFSAPTPQLRDAAEDRFGSLIAGRLVGFTARRARVRIVLAADAELEPFEPGIAVTERLPVERPA